MVEETQVCRHCGDDLQRMAGLPICPRCNDTQGEFLNFFSRTAADFGADSDKVMIECHGANLYKPGTDEVVGGVKFNDAANPAQGFEIVGHSVYGPAHVARRWVKKGDLHLIRRCQSCQDHTIRMRRKEGPDLYIPSRRHPNHRAHGPSLVHMHKSA
jgi:hypothetical protein